MGEVFLMKMNNIKQSFDFCEDFINDVVIYLTCIDDYFDIEENKENHKVHYIYSSLIENNNYKVLYDFLYSLQYQNNHQYKLNKLQHHL